jgi:hypothetical protein
MVLRIIAALEARVAALPIQGDAVVGHAVGSNGGAMSMTD